jgi:hypothetical protein
MTMIQNGIVINHPTFNAKYRLRGSNEEAIRAVFSTKVCDFLESHPDLCMETAIDWLLVYRAFVLVSPLDIESSLNHGLQAAALFS